MNNCGVVNDNCGALSEFLGEVNDNRGVVKYFCSASNEPFVAKKALVFREDKGLLGAGVLSASNAFLRTVKLGKVPQLSLFLGSLSLVDKDRQSSSQAGYLVKQSVFPLSQDVMEEKDVTLEDLQETLIDIKRHI